jgi:uncharacterized iron-regulated membrane protein
MESTLRASLNWLHTWLGVVLGGLLFAIFWMGTLSVFDREIDRWMAPMTRLPLPVGTISVDALRSSLEEAASAEASAWSVTFPTERQPFVRVTWRAGASSAVHHFSPIGGEKLADPGTLAGTRFLYPFHYMLHIRFRDIGIWVVGLASMAMLALCVTGVIVHRRIFADFFTLRTAQKPRRVILDLHNVSGVLGLPFHIGITLSGLIVFWFIYFPGGWQTAYPDRAAFSRDSFGSYDRPARNSPGETASLDAMVADARDLWRGAAPFLLSVRHPGDAAAYVSVFRGDEDRVAAFDEAVYFDSATGRLLHRRTVSQPIATMQRFISGLHLIRFKHWSLRWLYFGMGLLGCVTIATGYLFWLESRRRKHVQLGLAGVRVVEGLTIGSVMGIVIATLGFFVVNRLLPLGVTFAGYDRAALEIWTFYLIWLVTFAHAWLRPGWAWIEQCAAVTLLAVAAVVLNWITTGDHLARSLAHRHLWAVGGMDLLLLAGAAAAGLMAFRLRRRQAMHTVASS